MKSFHHAKPPVTIIVCSWKEKRKQMTYRYVFLYTYAHRHVHYLGNFWKPCMISISITQSGKTMYRKLLMFRKTKVLKSSMWTTNLILQKVPQLCCWHPWTLFHLLLARIYKALYPKLHHTNSQRNGIKCLTICTQIWNTLLIFRHKLLCQNHKICVSDIYEKHM